MRAFLRERIQAIFSRSVALESERRFKTTTIGPNTFAIIHLYFIVLKMRSYMMIIAIFMNRRDFFSFRLLCVPFFLVQSSHNRARTIQRVFVPDLFLMLRYFFLRSILAALNVLANLFIYKVSFVWISVLLKYPATVVKCRSICLGL